MISKKLEDLQLQHPLFIELIKFWLSENENYFYFLINESSCRKWNKWVEDKTIHIFPCCCPSREQDCIFIETYYKLVNIVKLHKNEDYFKVILQEYRIVANNKEQVLKWYKRYQKIVFELTFETEIDIRLNSEPYKNIILKIDANDFQNILDLQNIFYNSEYNQITKS